MFEKYPKTRPELTQEYKQIYERHYIDNRNGSSPASSVALKMERWLHKQISKDTDSFLATLEIGAGNLNQFEYEKIGKGRYDIIEPFKALFKNSNKFSYIGSVYNYIEDVPLSKKYDRIISCAVLEHIDNLPFVISKSGLLLNKDGCFRASVPNEGGFLWKLGYSLTTGLEFKRKYRLDYSVIMKHEHINNIDEIECAIKWFYKNAAIKRLGIGKHFSLYTFICARNPNIERCKEYYYSHCPTNI